MNKIIATDRLVRDSIGPNITFGNKIALAQLHVFRSGKSETAVLKPHFAKQSLEYLLTLQRSISEHLQDSLEKYEFDGVVVENWTTNAFLALLTPVVDSKVSEESAILKQLELKVGKYSKEILKSFLLKEVCGFDGIDLGAVRKDKYVAVFQSRIQVLEHQEEYKRNQEALTAKKIADNEAELNALVPKKTGGNPSSLTTEELRLQALDLKSEKAEAALVIAKEKVILTSLRVERSSVQQLLDKCNEVDLSAKYDAIHENPTLESINTLFKLTLKYLSPKEVLGMIKDVLKRLETKRLESVFESLSIGKLNVLLGFLSDKECKLETLHSEFSFQSKHLTLEEVGVIADAVADSQSLLLNDFAVSTFANPLFEEASHEVASFIPVVIAEPVIVAPVHVEEKTVNPLIVTPAKKAKPQPVDLTSVQEIVDRNTETPLMGYYEFFMSKNGSPILPEEIAFLTKNLQLPQTLLGIKASTQLKELKVLLDDKQYLQDPNRRLPALLKAQAPVSENPNGDELLFRDALGNLYGKFQTAKK